MPRSSPPADPPESHPNNSFVLTSVIHSTSSSAQFSLTGPNQPQELRSSLWPAWFSVYASPYCYQLQRNTRYRWLAIPYPTRTFTLQEMSSFLGAREIRVLEFRLRKACFHPLYRYLVFQIDFRVSNCKYNTGNVGTIHELLMQRNSPYSYAPSACSIHSRSHSDV
jgi:hypothetical protein